MSSAVELEVRPDRLVLRPFTDDDVDQMHAYQRLEDVARYLYRPPRGRQSCADTENLSSVRLCERLEMRREAHLIENGVTVAGTWGSEFVYAKLARDRDRSAANASADTTVESAR